MDKQSFFSQGALKTIDYTMPDGKAVVLSALSVAQRGKMRACVSKDSVKGQALVVCMACDVLDEKDIEAVMGMSGELVADISDKVLEISGLADKPKK